MEFRSTRSDGQLLYIEQEASRGKVSFYFFENINIIYNIILYNIVYIVYNRAGGKQREGEFYFFALIVTVMITLHQVGAGGRDFLSLSVLQRLVSCLRHSAQIGPDLLCQCHLSSVICHPLDWIFGPYYSLGWVHFERKYTF